MQLSQLKIWFSHQLKDEYPATEIGSFFNIFTEKYLGLRRIDVALKPELEISDRLIANYEKAILRLKTHEPVQYIIQETEFFGMRFHVNKNVLIPRPETEELVEWIVSDFQASNRPIEILDIGTGSGCISVSLARNIQHSKVTAYDISEKALELAKKNAEENNVNISFKNIDILQKDFIDEKFDIIVSNPPYVRELEKKEMYKNVLDHEPKEALYVEDSNALVFYKKIASLAKKCLNEHGILYFEINQYLAQETKKLVENFGFEAELKKDIFENYRMLKATRK